MNARLTRFALACTALLVATPTGLAKPVERRLPHNLIDTTDRKNTELLWRNGEKAGGETAGADSNLFKWQSPLFEDPITLPHDVIQRVDFSGSSQETSGAFSFTFIDGSHLTGDLKSLNAETATLSTNSCGEIVVQVSQLEAIERIRGESIIIASPASLLGGSKSKPIRRANAPDDPFAPNNQGSLKKNPAYIGAAGEVTLLEFNGGVRQEIDLPEKCLVQLRLRIEREPAFSIELSRKGKSIVLSTWADELVLSNDDQFVSAGPVPVSEDGQVALQIAWDQPAGTCTVFDKLSKPIAKLSLEEKKEAKPTERPKKTFLESIPLIGKKIRQMSGDEPVRTTEARAKPKKGVTLTNHGAGFVVEHYIVSEWAGKPPLSMETANDGVEISGEFIKGSPLASDGEKITIETKGGERELSLADVRRIHWSRAEKVGPDFPRSQLWYSDGNLLRGFIVEIDAGKAQLETSFADTPLSANLENSRRLTFPLSAKAPDKKPPTLKEMDTISVGGLLLRGSIRAEGSTLPKFLPTGSETALTPIAKSELVLRRHLSKDTKFASAGALLNTTDREVLPVTVDRILDDKVEFHWDATEVKEASTSNISSIQFPEPAMNFDEGFAAAGWKALGKRKKGSADSPKGEVTLEPGMGIGHPNILQGSDFGFIIKQANRHNTSLRIRLFCNGTRDKAESTNFLIATFGTIYAGLERGETGQFVSNNSDFPGANDNEIRVDFKFTGNKVEMRVNNQVAGSAKIDKKKGKNGSGLIIEPASVWGNSVGTLVIGNFNMRGSPLGVAPPSFDEDAKREALLIPRLRRDVPPKHILIGRNGDLLRGEIESKSDSHIRFRVGLETYEVPIERIGAIVWVEEADKTMNDVKTKPAEPKPAKKKKEPKKKVEEKEEAIDPKQQWLDLTNGGNLKLQVEAWNPDHVIGTHKLLGRCKIPTDQVHRVSLKKPIESGALAALSGWKFENTIDPNPPGQEEADVSPLVGKPAPDFTVKMLKGKDFKLSKAKGKVVVLDFWATWCAPCVRSLPGVIETMEKFPDDKVELITINQGEAKKQIEQFLEIRGFKMRVGFDPEMKTGEKFGVESIPYTVVIDSKGVVTYVSLGASSSGAQKLSDAVAKAVAEMPSNEF